MHLAMGVTSLFLGLTACGTQEAPRSVNAPALTDTPATLSIGGSLGKATTQKATTHPLTNATPPILALSQLDRDDDDVGAIGDNCPDTPNTDQANEDGDLIGDACDLCPADTVNDPDGDWICGGLDMSLCLMHTPVRPPVRLHCRAQLSYET